MAFLAILTAIPTPVESFGTVESVASDELHAFFGMVALSFACGWWIDMLGIDWEPFMDLGKAHGSA